MPKKLFTDDEVEREIARLQSSDAVKLARRVEAIQNRRRQRLYTLRMYEKRGKQLMADGVTMEALDIIDEQDENEDC